MKKTIIFGLFLGLFGCVQNSPSVVFINNSLNSIDSVKIYTNKNCPSLIIKNLKSMERKEGNILFCDKMQNDGNYIIDVYRKGKEKLHMPFGYYTNGASLNKGFKIELEGELIHVDQY